MRIRLRRASLVITGTFFFAGCSGNTPPPKPPTTTDATNAPAKTGPLSEGPLTPASLLLIGSPELAVHATTAHEPKPTDEGTLVSARDYGLPGTFKDFAENENRYRLADGAVGAMTSKGERQVGTLDQVKRLPAGQYAVREICVAKNGKTTYALMNGGLWQAESFEGEFKRLGELLQMERAVAVDEKAGEDGSRRSIILVTRDAEGVVSSTDCDTGKAQVLITRKGYTRAELWTIEGKTQILELTQGTAGKSEDSCFIRVAAGAPWQRAPTCPPAGKGDRPKTVHLGTPNLKGSRFYARDKIVVPQVLGGLVRIEKKPGAIGYVATDVDGELEQCAPIASTMMPLFTCKTRGASGKPSVVVAFDQNGKLKEEWRLTTEPEPLQISAASGGQLVANIDCKGTPKLDQVCVRLPDGSWRDVARANIAAAEEPKIECPDGKLATAGRLALCEKTPGEYVETLDAGKTWTPITLPKGTANESLWCTAVGCRIGPYWRSGWGSAK